jgi:Cu(I)/Ag(I) efflux system membrane fusion protein
MKKKHIFILIVVLTIGLLVGRYLVPSSPEAVHSHGSMDSSSVEPTIWTCSMHPQIQQPAPGDCPICGMDLIPLLDDSSGDDGPRTLSMSESSRALADIQTVEVQRDYPEAEIRLVGKLGYDETKVKSLTARYPARIDALYVNYTGISVARGEHLAQVYSPELLSAQRELIAAYQRDSEGALAAAARNKLRLWDLLPEQIEAILKRGTAEDDFELRAPISGVVVNKYVKEGDYVKTGEPLFRIVDLSELWLYLDAYESDITWLRFGQTVDFTVEAYPGEVFRGSITFIDPEFNAKTRTVAVRVNVPNPDGRLKPGMFARGTVQSRIAEDGNVYAPNFAGKWISPMHPEIVKDQPGSCDVCGMDLVPAEELGYVSDAGKAAPLVVPASAVLRTGKRAVVYVEKTNAERPTYEGREIMLGPKAGEFYIVESGLEAGEVVVTNGAFKIDSALQIQAKPSMMSVSGEGAAEPMPMELPKAHSEIRKEVLPQYFALQSSLAADDFAASQSALKAMMAVTGHSGDVAELIHAMLDARDLEGMRRPYFETLSNLVIAAVKADSALIEGTAYLMNCSMVYPDRGADWLQQDEELLNPYYGAMMLHCGEMKEVLGE